MQIFLYFLFLISTSVLAQTTELVIPYSSGGPSDIFARHVQRYLTKELNRNIVAVNKPGAEGRIGISYFQQRAESPALIVAATGPFVFNRVQYQTLNYDVRDFELVAPIITMPIVIAVNNRSTIRNLKDFVAASQTRNLACGVSAASSMFAAKYIKQSLRLDRLTIVPYKGVGDILVAVMGDNLDCIIDAGFASAHVDGRVRIIASADDVQDPAIGTVDLLKTVIPGYTQFNWWGIAWSRNSNVDWRSVLTRLHRDTEFTEAMRQLHYQVVSPSKNPAVFLSQEYERYERMRVSLAIDKENQ